MVDYSWVPWFRELARNIASRDLEFLTKRAKEDVDWLGDQRLLQEDYVDPFSFFYALASPNTEFARRLRSAGDAFSVKQDLPKQRPVPSPTARNPLFRSKDHRDPDLFWRLFLGAVKDEPDVDRALFDEALRTRNNVKLTKLTNALFLVNPDYFLSAQTDAPGALDSVSAALLPTRSVPDNYEDYDTCRRELLDLFPGCKPYEVNTFLYMQQRTDLVKAKSKFFQVSTSVDGDDSDDYWEEFDKQNWVRTGTDNVGPNRKPFPLDEPRPGDIILVRRGVRNGRAIGVVEANDYSEGWSSDKRISVYWINKRHEELAEGKQTARDGFGKAGQDSQTFQAFATVDGYSNTLNWVVETFRRGDESGPQDKREPFASGTEEALNQILFGPPGTGKTYEAVSAALKICGRSRGDRKELFDELQKDGRVAFVTFHQSYAYEDFIEGIRPALDGQALHYELRDGIFKRFSRQAACDPENRYVLIIDEINRGNIAKIFGELITLIEPSKRKGREDAAEAKLPYSQDRFSVPANLYLIGTMNTADRGIALLDTALRRRFKFVERMPDATLLRKGVGGVNCQSLLRSINERIVELLDRDHQVGHTYLRDVHTLKELADAFRGQVVPLLQEYFYDDWEKLRRVLNDNGFIESRKGKIVPEEEVFEVLAADDERWQQPESYQAIYGGNSGNASGA